MLKFFMSFSTETIQSKLWGLIIKYKKWLGFLAVFICILGSVAVFMNIADGKKNREVVNIIIECQDLEKQKKYQEAHEKLQIIYKDYSGFLKKYEKTNIAIDVYNYKLSCLNKNTKEAEEKILKNEYISQCWDYDNFSIAGEVLLLQKMMINYNNGDYQKCNDLFFEKKMLKLPHFIAYFYRAKAMVHLFGKEKSNEFLTQVLLYDHDYTQGYAKEIIKSLFFAPGK